MWNYAPGQNLAVHYALGSGMFPHDTLIGQIGLSLEDLTLASFDVWTGKESWALHGLDGHQDLRIQLIDANGQVLRQFEWQAGDDRVVPFPQSPGAYWIRYESRQGESASVSVIRP
jgi:hypothetical protein